MTDRYLAFPSTAARISRTVRVGLICSSRCDEREHEIVERSARNINNRVGVADLLDSTDWEPESDTATHHVLRTCLMHALETLSERN